MIIRYLKQPVIYAARSKKYKQQMLSINATIRAALLLLTLALTAHALTINYYKTVSSSNFRSSFALSYASSGSFISSIINPADNSAGYTLLLWRPGDSYPSKIPFQTIGPTSGAKILNSSMLDSSGNWRVQILPSSNVFLFNIEFKVDNSSVGKFAGLASNNRIFTLFNAAPGTYTININLSVPSISSLPAILYGPFNALTYTGAENSISAVTTSSYDSYISYTTIGNDYYYLVIQGSADLYNQAPLLRLTFQTDVYSCPYGRDAADYNGVFAGCSTSVPTSGYPCLNFNNIINRCTYCQTPWIADESGVCVQNTDCGQNLYYSYGQCLPVIAHCNNFQKFGGQCHGCEAGFTLGQSNGNQICSSNTPICKDNQYVLGNKCMNYVQNCANFITTTGICKDCKRGFTEENNVCVVNKVKSSIQCAKGQEIINGVCQLIDPNCLYYGNSDTCQLCADGYKHDGKKCVLIACPNRQYSVYGYCTDVSPLCGDYDKIYGNCLTCFNAFYVLQNDGKCVQTLDPSATGVVVLDCQDGYYPKGDTCVQVSALCDGYIKQTGACKACKTPQDYFLQNGVCLSIKGYCESQPRTFFKDGQCVKVSDLCDSYDSTTGACKSCRDNTVLDKALGICKYNEVCGSRQYHLPNGACADVSINCTTFDSDTGQCTGCKTNMQLNKGGVCCIQANYIDNPKCIPFLSQNCKTVRPNFGYCMECNDGFAKPNDYFFGKCQTIPAGN